MVEKGLEMGMEDGVDGVGSGIEEWYLAMVWWNHAKRIPAPALCALRAICDLEYCTAVRVLHCTGVRVQRPYSRTRTAIRIWIGNVTCN